MLLGTTNSRWATGARVVAADHGRAARTRNVVVALAGDAVPHLFTHTAAGVPDDHPADHVHPGLDLETDAGAPALVAFVADHVGGAGAHPARRVDHALAAHLGLVPAGVAVDDAAVNLMAGLKLVKTGDELACIRAAQHLNELAMHDVYAALRPGLRQCDLSGLSCSDVRSSSAPSRTPSTRSGR